MTAEAEAFLARLFRKAGGAGAPFFPGKIPIGHSGTVRPSLGAPHRHRRGAAVHHFPHENWIAALTRIGGQGGETPAEKTFFIPKDRIVEARLLKEPSFFKRLLSSSVPRLVVRYRPEGAGADAEPSTMAAEVDRDADQLAAALTKIVEAS
jgi:hypothetical protein